MNALYPANRSLGGLFLGFSAGYALMGRYFPFHAAGGVSKTALALRGLRIALGIAGGILIYQALKAVFSALPYYDLGRFVRYGLLGFWASAGAPWLFLRLRLARTPGQ
jgi:hypothetical protein